MLLLFLLLQLLLYCYNLLPPHCRTTISIAAAIETITAVATVAVQPLLIQQLLLCRQLSTATRLWLQRLQFLLLLSLQLPLPQRYCYSDAVVTATVVI